MVLEGNGTIEDLAFLPDGRLVTSHTGGPLLVRDAGFERWADRACRIANRNLAEAEWTDLVPGDIAYRPVCTVGSTAAD